MEKQEVKQRDYFFDNLRAIFIFLVVLGHFSSPWLKVYEIKFIYRYLYIFHMAGMLFISGYFFKSSVKDGKLVKNKFFNYILIYLVFQVIYTLINQNKFSLFQSQMGLWYLQLLIYYSLITPVISRIKPYICIPLCFVFGLLVGFDNSAGHIGSLSRAIVFLPFFMIGYFINKSWIEKLFKKKFIFIGLAILVIFGIILYFNLDNWTQLLNVSTGKYSYSAMKLKPIGGILYRSAWYVTATMLIISIIMVIPKKKCFISNIGKKSLQVFLIHLIICALLKKTLLYTSLKNLNQYLLVLISIGGATLITYITSLKIFSYPFDFLNKIKFKWMLKEENKE